MKKIEVSIRTFHELFDKRRGLKIPEYQRPYIWGKEKNEDLLKDFKEHFIDNDNGSNYYMGAVLYFLNKKESCFEIIDGQQRITTLLIINYLLKSLPSSEYFNITYNSHQSVKYIQEAQSYFIQHIDLLKKMGKASFMKRLSFTLITTHTEDEAFTFFDTQNNRGMKLDATDFLKAYHLRAIKSEFLQEESAIQWEKTSAKNFEGPFLSHLFEKILWRARNWKGQYQISFENRDAVLKTFQKNSYKAEQEDSYPLYPNTYNRLASGHIYKPNGELITYLSLQNGHDAAALPFTLRQPLFKGLNFFKYSEKYVAIHELLFHNDNISNIDILNFRAFYNSVYNNDMSGYLKHLMQLCMVAYYDIFGNEMILDAALCFDYLIGSVRIQKQQVKKEAVAICLKKNQNNLLDVIVQAYIPSEIFDFVYNLEETNKIYQAEKIEKEGVQLRYKRRIINYFNRSEVEFQNRNQWRRN
jgi:hypothetical protein